MSGYADRLAQMDGAYDDAPVAGGFEDLPPDGDYQVVVDRFDFIEAQKNGRLYLKTIGSVATGPHKGRTVSCLHDLEDADRLKYLKKHLAVLEVEPVSLRHLEIALKAALDVPFLVAVKTSGEYRNVYFNQKLGGPIRQPEAPQPTGLDARPTLDDVFKPGGTTGTTGPPVRSAIDDNIPF